MRPLAFKRYQIFHHQYFLSQIRLMVGHIPDHICIMQFGTLTCRGATDFIVIKSGLEVRSDFLIYKISINEKIRLC